MDIFLYRKYSSGGNIFSTLLRRPGGSTAELVTVYSAIFYDTKPMGTVLLNRKHALEYYMKMFQFTIL